MLLLNLQQLLSGYLPMDLHFNMLLLNFLDLVDFLDFFGFTFQYASIKPTYGFKHSPVFWEFTFQYASIKPVALLYCCINALTGVFCLLPFLYNFDTVIFKIMALIISIGCWKFNIQ